MATTLKNIQTYDSLDLYNSNKNKLTENDLALVKLDLLDETITISQGGTIPVGTYKFRELLELLTNKVRSNKPNMSTKIAISNGYSAATDGFILASCASSSSSPGCGQVFIDGEPWIGVYESWHKDWSGYYDWGWAPIRKGQTVTTTGGIRLMYFIAEL